MKLMERDMEILKAVEMFGFCLGRHICYFAGFTGQRACDRRLKVLCDNDFLSKKKIIYGLPYLYSLTPKGKTIIGANLRLDKIRVDRVSHDIVVLDSVMVFMHKLGLSLREVTSEKQLHSLDGFNTRRHHPDFVIDYDNKRMCVEIELSNKPKDKFIHNLESNYSEYDEQTWIIPKTDKRCRRLIKESALTDIFVMESEVITDYIEKRIK